MILKALKTCKKSKACGNDRIFYENIIYGGSLLRNVLKMLFDGMLTFSHTPTQLKNGIITTLFKGGNKKKTDPNSYRAISLCSCVLKLYEKVLMQLIDEDGKLEFNSSQGGFHKNVNSLMTSYMC